MATPSTGNQRRGLRAGGIAAIVFVVLFVIGFLMSTDTPDTDESNLKWVRYFADSGNRRMIIIGAILFAAAAAAFLVFLGVLRERLRGASTPEWLATVVFASGIAFVVMVAATGLGLGSVAASVTFGDAPVPRDADIMRTFESVAFGALTLFGAAFAGLLVFTTSLVSGRAALLPRWFVVTGYVVGVIVFFGGLLFFPMILFLLWMLVIGIVMLIRSGAATTP
jgi:hypothetical protein